MKRPGRRHLAVVTSADPRLQDSSPDLADALERAAEKYGARMIETPRVKYSNCLCGFLCRCSLLPDTPESLAARVTMYAAICPGCKRMVQVTFAPPQTAVQLAQPGDVPPATTNGH